MKKNQIRIFIVGCLLAGFSGACAMQSNGSQAKTQLCQSPVIQLKKKQKNPLNEKHICSPSSGWKLAHVVALRPETSCCTSPVKRSQNVSDVRNEPLRQKYSKPMPPVKEQGANNLGIAFGRSPEKKSPVVGKIVFWGRSPVVAPLDIASPKKPMECTKNNERSNPLRQKMSKENTGDKGLFKTK